MQWTPEYVAQGIVSDQFSLQNSAAMHQGPYTPMAPMSGEVSPVGRRGFECESGFGFAVTEVGLA